MKIFFAFIFILTGFIILESQVFAYIDVVPAVGNIPLPEVNGVGEAGDFIGAVIAWLIGLTAVLAILAITWAAIHMVLAVGDEEKMKKARYIMIYAFIGLFVSGIAYGAVTFVTRLNLNNFL